MIKALTFVVLKSSDYKDEKKRIIKYTIVLYEKSYNFYDVIPCTAQLLNVILLYKLHSILFLYIQIRIKSVRKMKIKCFVFHFILIFLMSLPCFFTFETLMSVS